MGKKSWWCAALLLAACGGAGVGGDPEDAPGCDQNTRKCDGAIVQLCVLDPVERRAVWRDVQDCTEVEATCEQRTDRRGAATADCDFSAGDAGVSGE